MGGLCGWVNFSGNQELRAGLIKRMGASLACFDHGKETILYGVTYAAAVNALSERYHLAESEGGVAAVFGDPRIIDKELADLAQSKGLVAALIRGFKDHGPGVLRRLYGHFSVFIALERERQALIAVDRVGVCPLVYASVDGGLVFGSTSDAINRYSGLQPRINHQAIYNYLYFHVVPGADSVFEGQSRLIPGSYAHLSGNRLETGTYWEVEYQRENERLPFEELKREFRNLLQESVRREVGDQAVGAFLSGGTDSSTVSGILGEVTGKPARTYSIGFKAEGYDEMEYARITARHFQTNHHEYYVTPDDVVNAIPKIAQLYDSPFGNSSAVPAYYCAAFAKNDGVTRLFAGDGGDELFGGNARYATQYLLSLYSDLPESLRRRLIEPVLNSIPAGTRLPVIRKVLSYIKQASVPLPARLETYNLLERLGIENVVEKNFLASVDTAQPLFQLSQVYNSAHAQTTLNRILAIDLRFTLADNDLPKVSKTCEMAGTEVVFPLLSDDLMAFAARLPVKFKLKRTRLRYFFKEALKDFLPPEVISKRKHGFGLPFGPWLLSHRPLYELARDNLSDLKGRGIVRADFIDALFERHVAEHAGYYSTMVWILMMLELWFKHHEVQS